MDSEFRTKTDTWMGVGSISAAPSDPALLFGDCVGSFPEQRLVLGEPRVGEERRGYTLISRYSPRVCLSDLTLSNIVREEKNTVSYGKYFFQP